MKKFFSRDTYADDERDRFEDAPQEEAAEYDEESGEEYYGAEYGEEGYSGEERRGDAEPEEAAEYDDESGEGYYEDESGVEYYEEGYPEEGYSGEEYRGDAEPEEAAEYDDENGEGYYGEESGVEYYEEEYPEEGYSGEEYRGNAEPEEAAGYDENGEGYYGEESGVEYYGAENGEEYYGDEEYFENMEFEDVPEYEEDAGYEDQDERAGIFAWFADLAPMDYVMLCAGAAVLVLAVIIGATLIGGGRSTRKLTQFAEVGSQLDGVEVIGDRGLLAVADARIARMEASKLLEENEGQYDEAEYNKEVTVMLKTVSVQKDLKIKFVSQSSGKLISNVPFTVSVTTPDSKSETWDDDDMDGIIYRQGITPGSYQVSVNSLDGERYRGCTLPTGSQTVNVRKDIAYQKVDVSDEVKTESQVNVATEEQKKQEPEVESSLTDTVEWVESTEVTSTYVEVSRASIPNPMETSKAGNFLRTAKEVKLNHTSAELEAGETLKLKASYSLNNVVSVGWDSSDNSVAEVDVDGVVTGVSAGSATIYCFVTVSKDTDEGTEEVEYSAACEVTVKAADGDSQQDPSGEESSEQESSEQDPSEQEPSEPESSASGKGSIRLDRSAVTVYVDSTATVKAVLDNTASDEITAKSSDKKTASVEVDGKTVTITGVKAGTATVTVKAETEEGTVSATCAVTVKEDPREDSQTLLKDGNGNQLYVQEGDSYREAVVADYFEDGIKFFRKGETKYTGWQTIDGKVYFFDKTGKKVTGEQVIQGAKYTFASDGSLVTGSGSMGIDVSRHNGSIDWKAVKNSGVSYVIIRCGYRGYTQGSLIIDSMFEQNIKGATAAGLKVGVYFFSQAVNEVEAVEEASFVLDVVKNYKISYPLFLDVEYSGASGNKGRADGLGRSERTAVCKAFCATIQSGGYTAGIYANKSWMETMIDPGQLGAYKIWLAQYAASPTYTGRHDLWQYKSTGRVSGISGNVDMNLSYLGY